MNNENYEAFDDQIDLLELFWALWNRKLLITLVTTFSAIFSVMYSLSLPNIYTSYALLAPTNSDDSLSSKLGGLTSLAGIAGVSLPGKSASKAAEAIARIQSYDFFVKEFVPNIKFENLVAVEKWTQASNTIIYNPEVFNKIDNTWVRAAKFPKKSKPSNQEAYKSYKLMLSIAEDKKTQFVSLKITHKSPYIAEKWSNIIITNINHHMRDLDKAIAENSINYLNTTSQKTNLTTIKTAISKLLENQMQTLMLAESTIDYVFKPIEPPIIPELKSSPSRARICIVGTFLGFILGLIIALCMYFFNFKKK